MQNTAKQLNQNTYSQNAQKSLNSNHLGNVKVKHYKLTAKAKNLYLNALGWVIVTGIIYILIELALRCFE